MKLRDSNCPRWTAVLVAVVAISFFAAALPAQEQPQQPMAPAGPRGPMMMRRGPMQQGAQPAMQAPPGAGMPQGPGMEPGPGMQPRMGGPGNPMMMRRPGMMRRGMMMRRQGMMRGPSQRQPGIMARPGMGPGGPGALLRLPQVQKELGITDEQRKKLEDIGFNANKARIQQQATLEIARMELERLKRADAPDRAAIDKKIQEIAQAEGATMRADVNAELDVRGVLTKEQREKLAQGLEKLQARRMQPMMNLRGGQPPAPGKPAVQKPKTPAPAKQQ